MMFALRNGIAFGKERRSGTLGALFLALSGLAACVAPSPQPFGGQQIVSGGGSGALRPDIEAPLQGMDPSLRLSRSETEGLADAIGMALVSPETRSEGAWAADSGTRGLVEAGPAFFAGIQDMHGDPLRVPITLTSSFVIVPTQARVITSTAVIVRNGPGTDYVKLQTIPKDTRLNVVGQVGASDWVLVAKGSQGLGYMHRPLLITEQIAPLPDDARVGPGGIVDLAENPGAAQGGYTDAELDRLLAGDTASRPVMCRDLRHTVLDRNGREYRWASTACRVKALLWRIVNTGVGRS